MNKKEEKVEKKPLLMYARDCMHGKEEINQLIQHCDALSTEEQFNWETGVRVKANIVGCHTQTMCKYYKKKG